MQLNPAPFHRQPQSKFARLAMASRLLVWMLIGGILLAGVFSSSNAWAQGALCFGRAGQSSIPVAPLEIFLRYTGTPAFYQVSLCEPSSAPVTITPFANIAGRVVISPNPLVIDSTNSTVPRAISVTVAAGYPQDQPFTVEITHTLQSADPNFNFNALTPRVTAYYSPPVALDDAATTPLGEAVVIDVNANDLDRRGLGLTNTIVTQPDNGTVTAGPGNDYTYTPDAGFSGADSFTYRVEDPVGNTDEAVVTIIVTPAGVVNPQVEVVVLGDDPVTIQFESALGEVQVEIPLGLLGDAFPPDTPLTFSFGEVPNPTGDLDNPPSGASFSGIAFNLELFVNGELFTGELEEPLTITLTLPDTFESNGAMIIIAIWDGTTWQTEGINIEDVTETTAEGEVIRFTTTVLGEFVIFIQHVVYIPVVERAQAAR